jgi:hypothetical protein
MLVRIFDSGTSHGESPINYLMGDHDHTGKLRPIRPEVIEGDPKTTVAIINSISRKHKYISGAISFRDTEHPTKEQLRSVINEFKASFAPGLTSDNFNSLWVIHRDKGNTELHFVVPRIELATGKAFNIHPPGRKNIEHYEMFTSVMNHKLGYAQIQPDPLKLVLSTFELKAPAGKRSKNVKEPMHRQLERQIRSGAIKNRAQLCEALEDQFGLQIPRQGVDYMSVLLPGQKKALRLRGGIYARDADYAEILRTPPPPKYLTPDEFKVTSNRLKALVAERRDFNIRAYQTHSKMRREQVEHNRQHFFHRPASPSMGLATGNGWTNRPPAWLVPVALTPCIPASRHAPSDPVISSSSPASLPAGDSLSEIIGSIKEIERNIESASASVANARSPAARARALRLLANLETQKARLEKQLIKAKENANRMIVR